ncbi:hypothetical protein MUP59_06345 [Candidatus Bathyarchaeota archaeon]|nr:hypothetical protein [Candidatus Bathyarchaeota archaeon]
MEAECISRERAANFAASPEEVERCRLLTEEQYGPEFCPICGEKTKNECGWWSQVYRMPGWRCSTGGVSHFLRWVRENRRQYV